MNPEPLIVRLETVDGGIDKGGMYGVRVDYATQPYAGGTQKSGLYQPENSYFFYQNGQQVPALAPLPLSPLLAVLKYTNSISHGMHGLP